jgi:hypothetical protein
VLTAIADKNTLGIKSLALSPSNHLCTEQAMLGTIGQAAKIIFLSALAYLSLGQVDLGGEEFI